MINKRNPAYINAMKRRQRRVEDNISHNTSRFDRIFKWGPPVIVLVIGLIWGVNEYRSSQDQKFRELQTRQNQLESEQEKQRWQYNQDMWHLKYKLNHNR